MHFKIRVRDASITVLEPHLRIRLFFTLNSTSTKSKQLHVRPVNAAVIRASSLRLRLIITVDISREVGVFGNEAAQVYKLVNLVVLLAAAAFSGAGRGGVDVSPDCYALFSVPIRRVSVFFSDTVKPKAQNISTITAIILASPPGDLEMILASSAYSIPHTALRTRSSSVSSGPPPLHSWILENGVVFAVSCLLYIKLVPVQVH